MTVTATAKPITEISFSPLPVGASAHIVDYKEIRGSDDSFIKLVQTAARTANLRLLPQDRMTWVRVRVIDKETGQPSVGAGYRTFWDPSTSKPVENRPTIADTAVDPPKVKAVETHVEITAPKPVGQPQDEGTVEIRHGNAGGNVEDAVYVTTAAPGEVVTDFAWPEQTDQVIFTRYVRADGQAKDWVETPCHVPDLGNPDDNMFEGDFALATLEALVTGLTPMESVGGGGGRFATFNIGNASAVTIGDADGLLIGDAELKWGEGVFRTPTFEEPELTQARFQLGPELGASQTRIVHTIGDAANYPICPPEIYAGSFDLAYIRAQGFQIGGEKTPIVFEPQIAVSASPAATFVPADFKPLEPGAIYSYRTAQVRIRVRNWFGKNTFFLRFLVRRLCVCDPCCCCPEDWRPWVP